jgi:AP-1-like factor
MPTLLFLASFFTPETALAKPSKPGSMSMVPSFDWLAQQNGGQFDPVLFGDYREPQDAITSGDYGFFSDALPFFDFSTPLSDGLLPSPPVAAATGTASSASMAPASVAAAVATTSRAPAAAISPDSGNKRSSAVSTEQAKRDAAREQLKVEVNCETLW